MANTTDEYWEINGVSLHQYNWNVVTLGGGRYALPEKRGTDIQLAYRPGVIPRAKVPEPRVISLGMWLTGANSDGSIPEDTRLKWNDSWDFLRRLVWSSDGQLLTLTKRTHLTIDDEPTMLVADALCEMTGTMDPNMTGRTRGEFVMQLLLHDPYFYDRVERQVTVNAGAGVVEEYNPGMDAASFKNLTIELHGPLNDAVLSTTGMGLTQDIWFKYLGTISAGQTVIMNLEHFQAHVVASGANVVRAISHAGSRYWFEVKRGLNKWQLTSNVAGGYAVIKYRPPYL